MSRPEITSDRRRVAEIGDGPAQAAARAIAFGPFVADAESGRLLEAGRVIALAPKPFETLYYLAGQAGRVVPKRSESWGDRPGSGRGWWSDTALSLMAI